MTEAFLLSSLNQSCASRTRLFPRFLFVTSSCFSLLSTGHVFFGAFRRLRVFPRFSSVTYFPRFSSVTCFSALSVSYIFSRPFHWLLVFACFSTASVSRAFRRLHVFPTFSVKYIFSRAFRRCMFSYTGTLHPARCFLALFGSCTFCFEFSEHDQLSIIQYLKLPRNKVNKTV